MSDQKLGPRPAQLFFSKKIYYALGTVLIAVVLGVAIWTFDQSQRYSSMAGVMWFCLAYIPCCIYFFFIMPRRIEKRTRQWDEANAQIQLAEKKAAEKAAKRLAWENNARLFYSACASRNITIDSPDISLIANSFNIGRDREEAFEFGRSSYLAQKEVERKAADAEERSAAKRMADYAEIIGKEKYLRVFKSKLESGNAMVVAANAVRHSLITPTAPHISDWAVAGGMAQGLAGPAAGAAAAINTMKSNQEARDAAEQQRRSYESTASSLSRQSVKGRVIAENAAEMINLINEKLIKQDENALFSVLAPSETSISLSPGGNIIVDAEIEGTWTDILETEGCIDGSIEIEVVNADDDSVVAHGIYAAPGLREDPLEAELQRLDKNSKPGIIGRPITVGFPLCTRKWYEDSYAVRRASRGKIRVLCIREADHPITNCTNLACRFSPHHLWAIER